jgi:hypothetical protein
MVDKIYIYFNEIAKRIEYTSVGQQNLSQYMNILNKNLAK